MALLGLTAAAQPAPVKNVAKSVFTLTTFKQDGTLLASSHGVFIDADGTAVSDWSPFVGADKAVVIDANGKKMDVVCLIGASEIYDMAKFRVDGKTVAATLASTTAPAGSSVYLVGYAVKKPTFQTCTVKKSETFSDKYGFYVIDIESVENVVNCPFVNANGQVIGLLQTTRSGEIHSTDVRFAADFTVNSLSANNQLLRKSSLPVDLPDGLDNAQLALMIASQTGDASKYAQTVEQFIRKFPQSSEGYSARANLHMVQGDFSGAAADMEKALSLAENKADAHFKYANLIYQKEVYQSDSPYEPWSMDRALEEVRQATSLDPQPLYRHLEGQILYSKGDYQSAYDLFMSLTSTDLKNPELYYEAAQCKSHLEAEKQEIVALLDSAVANCPKPYTLSSAPYFLARALAYQDAGEYRKAVVDMNQYDTLTLGRNTAEFYFQREQCEVKAKMFQQALADIDLAIRLSPQDVDYYAEKGSLLLRIGQYDEAIAVADRCLLIDEEYSDAYLIKGVAEIMSGKKKIGLATLAKAQAMGNPQAETLINKYK